MKTLISRALASVAVVAALGGCAHSLVYNEARDKQGQEAKRAATEVKMADKVRALEKTHAEVAKLEEQSATSLAQMLRDRELLNVARAKSLRAVGDIDSPDNFDGLLTVLENRMALLGAKAGKGDTNLDGKGIRNCGPLECASLSTIQDTPVRLRAERRSFELSRAEFRAFMGYDFRTCADVDAAKDAKNPATLNATFAAKFAAAARQSKSFVDAYYKALADVCMKMVANEKAFSDALEPKKEIGTVLADANRAEKEVADHKAQLVKAEADLAGAIKEFSDEEKKLAVNKENPLSKLEERANKLKTVVENVKKIAGTVSDAGSHATAQALVDKLDTVLGAVAGQDAANQKLDPDDRAAVAFVRAIPELAGEADKLLKEAGGARLVPFAIARDHYRLTVKGFEDELAVKTRRADTLRSRADAMTHELEALVLAHYNLTNDKRAWETQSLAQLNGLPNAADRQQLYQGLAIYWDEVFLHRSKEQMWKARARALRYEEGLARSAAAAQQWDNLIGGVGTVLADYHASGVKPSDITEFLKVLGLVYIGTRIGR